MPTWENNYVLCAVENGEQEQRTGCYQIYRFSHNQDDLTPADNYFDTAAWQASMQVFRAVPVAPAREWQVCLASVPAVWVTMGVFQLQVRT